MGAHGQFHGLLSDRMTIADYIALGTLIVLAIWAVAKLYL